jgi:hypothetical protein
MGIGKLFGFIAQRQVRPSVPARIAFPSPFLISQTSLAFRALQSDSCRDGGHHRQRSMHHDDIYH